MILAKWLETYHSSTSLTTKGRTGKNSLNVPNSSLKALCANNPIHSDLNCLIQNLRSKVRLKNSYVTELSRVVMKDDRHFAKISKLLQLNQKGKILKCKRFPSSPPKIAKNQRKPIASGTPRKKKKKTSSFQITLVLKVIKWCLQEMQIRDLRFKNRTMRKIYSLKINSMSCLLGLMRTHYEVMDCKTQALCHHWDTRIRRRHDFCQDRDNLLKQRKI